MLLVQINADNIVGFKFVRNGAVPYTGNHDGKAFAFFYEIFGADGVKEALTDSDIAKLDTAAGRLRSHAGWFHHALGVNFDQSTCTLKDLLEAQESSETGRWL